MGICRGLGRRRLRQVKLRKGREQRPWQQVRFEGRRRDLGAHELVACEIGQVRPEKCAPQSCRLLKRAAQQDPVDRPSGKETGWDCEEKSPPERDREHGRRLYAAHLIIHGVHHNFHDSDRHGFAEPDDPDRGEEADLLPPHHRHGAQGKTGRIGERRGKKHCRPHAEGRRHADRKPDDFADDAARQAVKRRQRRGDGQAAAAAVMVMRMVSDCRTLIPRPPSPASYRHAANGARRRRRQEPYAFTARKINKAAPA